MEFKELMVVESTRYKVPSTKYFLNERSISKEKDREIIKGNNAVLYRVYLTFTGQASSVSTHV